MNPHDRKRPTGSPLSATMIERLVRACVEHGTALVRETSGLSEASFFRGLSGERVHHGTSIAIESALRALGVS